MNIIKPLNGIKILGSKKNLFLFLLSIILFSCEDEVRKPNIYKVIIKNNYFEKINKINLGNHKIDTLNIKEQSDTLLLKKGIYSFYCTTESKLVLKNSVKIQGYKSVLDLVLEKEGVLYFK